MGIFHNLAEAFTHGYRMAETFSHGNRPARGRFERLCAEAGWGVDQREGDTISLYFKEPLTGRRIVNIGNCDGALPFFYVGSYVSMPSKEVPEEVLGHLLIRNHSIALGGWRAQITDEGKAMFALVYTALGDGLTVNLFKHICEKMAGEVNDFDSKMHKAGLL
jgi:hypothetical protein